MSDVELFDSDADDPPGVNDPGLLRNALRLTVAERDRLKERVAILEETVDELNREALRQSDRLRLTKSGAEQYARDLKRVGAENRKLRERAAALKIGLQGLVDSYLKDGDA